MLFGSEVSFKTLPEAEEQWDGIAEEVEEVQYSDNARGRGKRRRRITSTVRKFIARAERFRNKADDADKPLWKAFVERVDREYESMLETKNVLREHLDNVW